MKIRIKPINYKGVCVLVSDNGRVWNARTMHEISPNVCSSGYLSVTIYQKPNKIKEYIQRLVCTAFHDNHDPKHLTDVNHINGIKTDNRACNLEWCSRSDNQKHSYKMGLHPITNSKKVYCAETKTTYPSMHEASRAIGYSKSYVRNLLSGRYKNNSYHFSVVE